MIWGMERDDDENTETYAYVTNMKFDVFSIRKIG